MPCFLRLIVVCFEGDNTCDYWCKQIGSAKDVTERMSKVRDTLSDVNADWEKRTDAVRLIHKLYHSTFIIAMNACNL